MEALMHQLVAIRESVDAAITTLALMMGIDLSNEALTNPIESINGAPVDQEQCKHEHKQNVAGANMPSELFVCVDCGKEL